MYKIRKLDNSYEVVFGTLVVNTFHSDALYFWYSELPAGSVPEFAIHSGRIIEISIGSLTKNPCFIVSTGTHQYEEKFPSELWSTEKALLKSLVEALDDQTDELNLKLDLTQVKRGRAADMLADVLTREINEEEL